ncbi:DNA-binding response regulator [Clostridia bacterium]|nr:DNA-binding response regulator [Clostridia bacterium]
MAELIESILEERGIEADIDSFKSGEELLAKTRRECYSAYFLDIYMTGVTGVQVACAIRENDPDAVLVFTTSSPDHMAEGFDVGAVHYILKPVTREAAEQAVGRMLRNFNEYERYITVLHDRLPYKLLLSEILAAESRDKSCIITAKTRILYPYIRLKELEEMLNDERFLHCHRSYLINMDYAVGVVEGGFKLTNGMLIPIKRDRRQEMKQQFSEYCFKKLRKEM